MPYSDCKPGSSQEFSQRSTNRPNGHGMKSSSASIQMSEYDPPMALALADLTSNAEFLKIESDYREAFVTRIRHAKVLLTRVIRPMLPLTGMAILARGSLARGDFSPHSDIDLLLITRVTSSKLVLDLELIRRAIGRRTSVAQVSFSDLERRMSTLPHLAYALGSACFICGDGKLVTALHADGRELLKKMLPARLIGLRTDDPGRTWKDLDPLFPHYYSLKQGKGGFVDYEFIKLVGLWLKARRHFNPLVNLALRHSFLAYRYWAILKEFLQLWSGGPLESCQPLYPPFLSIELAASQIPKVFRTTVIDLVREAHSNALTLVLAEIRKEEKL
jgi:hypothetical protein